MTDTANILPNGAEHATAGDLQAMLRVLEKRCRDYQDQVQLGEQGRRQVELQLRQQQIQVDIAIQHQHEAEAVYQQVQVVVGRVAAQLREEVGPRAEQLATSLEALVGPDAQRAVELGTRLVWLLRAAHRPHRTVWSAPGAWVGRGVVLALGALALSIVLGIGGAAPLRVALVPLAVPAPIVTGLVMRAADADWTVTAHELDTTWEHDWPRTVALLDDFLDRWPGYGPAQDKLYAALVADGQARISVGQGHEGVAQLERAARLLPQRGEAFMALANQGNHAP